MAVTTALSTALSGLDASGRKLDVVGNNIANVNTTAYKRSRATFETQISQTLSNASAPSAELGGTNPLQVGLGTQLSAIQKDHSNGSIKPTGVAGDLAIDGQGLFIVNDAGQQKYTRKGDFTLDSESNLVGPNGARLQGYGVDEQFNVIDGDLGDINLPIGAQTLAAATSEVTFAGNLNAGGQVATQGSITESAPLYATASGSGGAAAGSGTQLTSLYDASGGTPLLATGDVVSLSGATKGGASVPEATFEVGPTNTTGSTTAGQSVGDLLTFFDNALGIDASQPGVNGPQIDGSGVIRIEGNEGEANNIVLDNADVVTNQGGASPNTPFEFTATQEADGESARTTFVAFDSLGNPHTVDLTAVLDTKDNTGTQWNFTSTAADDSDADGLIGSGTLNFDSKGKLVSTTNNDLTLDLDQTGALTPQAISLGFESDGGGITALADNQSQLNATGQDGKAIGTLSDFSIGSDGTIEGIFSNNLIRTLGQIPLAKFPNTEGLRSEGGSFFEQTAGSGLAQITSAAQNGTGSIVDRSLEQSNVDLSDEFVDLISASTGFSANSRVISTSDQLIQELLATAR